MARRLTSSEAFQLRSWFPTLDTGSVWVLGEATPRYNCLAWALGITSSWVWPWGGRNATDSEMTSFLRRYGLVPSSSGSRLTYGMSWSSIGHICRYSGSTWGWTSKVGRYLLITHGRDALVGAYGTRRRFYTAGAAVTGLTEGTELGDDEAPMTDSPLPPLDRSAIERLDQMAAAADPALVEEFDRRYGAWKSALLAVSESEGAFSVGLLNSTAAGFSGLPEFAALVALGSEILPLVMRKLADPDEWPAVLLADVFVPYGVGVEFDLDDERVLTGEQGRARLTLDAWLESQD
jgi:hypothetical protein